MLLSLDVASAAASPSAASSIVVSETLLPHEVSSATAAEESRTTSAAATGVVPLVSTAVATPLLEVEATSVGSTLSYPLLQVPLLDTTSCAGLTPLWAAEPVPFDSSTSTVPRLGLMTNVPTSNGDKAPGPAGRSLEAIASSALYALLHTATLRCKCRGSTGQPCDTNSSRCKLLYA
eukprot:GHUV01029766.1.p2 GENE.GHUV01029766.1~~GHUV01029766.1.p2  ORF type:complete len:177 (+),score=27.23 GHUV01029766.1:1391-1921(+)